MDIYVLLLFRVNTIWENGNLAIRLFSSEMKLERLQLEPSWLAIPAQMKGCFPYKAEHFSAFPWWSRANSKH